jgi:D-arginine dehydrogenase
MTQEFDIVVIGAGMAGASIAAALTPHAGVAILEMEDRPGYHTTGRSAATFIETYGNATIRKLTRASRAFLEGPPSEITDASLLSPRGLLYLAHQGQEAAFEDLLREAAGLAEIAVSEAVGQVPVLAPGAIRRAAFGADVMAIDVDRLHAGYLRAAKARGGALYCRAKVEALHRDGRIWRLETRAGRFAAPVVVNAAGAWADWVAEAAGAAPVGLTPMRRSAAIIPPPDGVDVSVWPLVGDVGETYYFLPMGGRLMVSPADETPVEPHDAYADDLDLAEGIDRFQQAVTFEVRRVEHSWAGLRTFAPDRSPVVGFDPERDGLFWFAGQGGYGIQTAPAMATLGASLILEAALPADLSAMGFEVPEVDPRRLNR